MLAANECVATWLEDLGVPSLYRIHEKPEPRRVVQFEELAASFGYSLGLGPLPVKRVQTRGERRESHAARAAIRASTKCPKISPSRRACIRSSPRASRASPKSASSATSCCARSPRRATPRSTRATSPSPRPPIRTSPRPSAAIPTSIVHRIAKALLRAGVSRPGHHRRRPPRLALVAPQRSAIQTAAPILARLRREVPHVRGSEIRSHLGIWAREASPLVDAPIPEPELAQIAEESSQAERRAAEAERELVEWKKVRFMQDRVGDEFAALVLNPAKYGLFVELTDLFVEGLVPIDTLRGDRYTWRENTHEIVGERTGRRFRAGDRVQVILDRILAQERKLQFALVEEELTLTGRASPQDCRKAKEERAQRQRRAAQSEKRQKRQTALTIGTSAPRAPQ